MGKLIVIEGSTDSSGKKTQAEILTKRLLSEGFNVRLLTFPNYKSKACTPVEMYLNGEFGEKAMDVNPYTASTFYAIDRYASFKTDWENIYNEPNSIIITDRYVTSNYIHQGSKLDSYFYIDRYCDWISDLEYRENKIPRPDLVVFLNMPFELGSHSVNSRNSSSTSKKADIHEKDIAHLERAYRNSLYIAKAWKWNSIDCAEGKKLRSIEEISEDIYKEVKQNILNQIIS